MRLWTRECIGVAFLFLGCNFAGAVEVDDGSGPAEGTVLASEIVGVPSIGSGESSFTAAGTVVTTLGAFDIVINPGATLAGNAPALAAFNRAAAQWESFIADPITINIDADLAPLAPGVLGSAGSVQLSAGFNTIRDAMVTDSADEADDGIVASLPTAAQASFNVPVGFGLSGGLTANKANLKALGFTASTLDGTSLAATVDATITFSTGFAFDFDNSDGITAGQFDFEGVAAHEIGHALGFTSTVDTVDFLVNQGMTSTGLNPTAMDLFRFADGTANDPDNAAQFTTAARSLLPGSTDIFDQVDDSFGGDAESLMSTGAFTGDGRQASHFKDNLSIGIMDPTLAPGELVQISANDLRVFDLIGYEIAAIPEPSSVLALLCGTGFVAIRRRRA